MKKGNQSITRGSWWLYALLTALLLALLLPATASAVPTMPHQFYGNVTANGSPAWAGISVSAKINGIQYVSTTTDSQGRYGYSPVFMVPADDPDTTPIEGGVNGDTISFYVNGTLMGTTVVFQSGTITPLNFSVSIDEGSAPTPTVVAPTVVAPTTTTGGGTTTGGETTTTQLTNTILTSTDSTASGNAIAALAATDSTAAGNAIAQSAATNAVATGNALAQSAATNAVATGNAIAQAAATNAVATGNAIAQAAATNAVATGNALAQSAVTNAVATGNALAQSAVTNAEATGNAIAQSAADNAVATGAALAAATTANAAATGSALAFAANNNPAAAGQAFNNIPAAQGNTLLQNMSESSLTLMLPEASAATLFALDTATLFAALPNAPTEQLAPGQDPTPDPQTTAPVIRYQTASGEQAVAIRTVSGGWVVLIGTPIPVSRVMVKTTSDLQNVVTTLDLLPGKPASIPAGLPDGYLAYAYLNISFENAVPADIQIGYIDFQIEQNWIAANNILKWSVVIYQYDDAAKEWVSLQAKRVAEDSTYVYYTATIPEFSVMAIAGATTLPSPTFEVMNMTFNPGNVEQGKTIQINADVKNLTSITNICNITMWINNTVYDASLVSVPANSTKGVVFQMTPTVIGDYKVRIERQMGSFTVLPASAPAAKYILTIAVDPVGSGTVAVDPVQPADGYVSGAVVTLTAAANKGYKFDRWSGDISGTTQAITITMDSYKSLTANFTAEVITPVPSSVKVSVFPQNGAEDVPLNTTISMAFDQAMDKQSVEGAFSITPEAEGTLSWNANTLVFTPTQKLKANTTYTITISTAAKNAAGSNLSESYVFSMTTKPAEKTNWTLWIVLIVIVALVIIAVGVFIIRRQKKTPAAQS